MFQARAHHQEVKIALHSLWYHHTYRCDDTRGNKTTQNKQISPTIYTFLAQTVKTLHSTKQKKTDFNSTTLPLLSNINKSTTLQTKQLLINNN